MFMDSERLKSFAVDCNSPCVSVYIPLEDRVEGAQKGSIRLKNALKKAQAQLEESGDSGRKTKETLASGWQVIDDLDFWREATDGLALFFSKDGMNHIWLPDPVEEMTVVAERPYIRPLIPFLEQNTPFHILSISPKQVRLLRAKGRDARELQLGDDIPASLPDALGYQTTGKPLLQRHTRSPRPQSQAPGSYYHGFGEEDPTEEIERFLRVVDQGVCRRLTPADEPLIVAGVERIVAAYQRLTKYPNIHEKGIVGNPDELSSQELGEEGWELVRQDIDRRRDEALRRFYNVENNGHTLTDLRRLLPAVIEGSIDTLFLSRDDHIWGTYDRFTDRFELQSAPGKENEDLLEYLAVAAFQRGATVYTLDRRDMPKGEMAAAILRYSS